MKKHLCVVIFLLFSLLATTVGCAPHTATPTDIPIPTAAPTSTDLFSSCDGIQEQSAADRSTVSSQVLSQPEKEDSRILSESAEEKPESKILLKEKSAKTDPVSVSFIEQKGFWYSSDKSSPDMWSYVKLIESYSQFQEMVNSGRIEMVEGTQKNLSYFDEDFFKNSSLLVFQQYQFIYESDIQVNNITLQDHVLEVNATLTHTGKQWENGQAILFYTVIQKLPSKPKSFTFHVFYDTVMIPQQTETFRYPNIENGSVNKTDAESVLPDDQPPVSVNHYFASSRSTFDQHLRELTGMTAGKYHEYRKQYFSDIGRLVFEDYCCVMLSQTASDFSQTLTVTGYSVESDRLVIYANLQVDETEKKKEKGALQILWLDKSEISAIRYVDLEITQSVKTASGITETQHTKTGFSDYWFLA